MRREMKKVYLALWVLGCGISFSAMGAEPVPRQAVTERSSSSAHDFDFLIGDWQVRNRQLAHRLADSHEWVEFDASDSFHALAGGLGVEENYRTEHWPDFHALGLHLYDPTNKRWTLYWADTRNSPGTMQTLASGEFKGDAGTFYAPDTFNGKPITVRVLWQRKDETHVHWEQAFSADDKKTWETNWTMDFTRTAKQTATSTNAAHGFDFLVGKWNVGHRRLKHRLAHSDEWETFEGTCESRLMLDGQANVDENVLVSPAGVFRAATVRMFDPGSKSWAIWWFDSRQPHKLDPPLVGTFKDGVGTFFSDDQFEGRPIRVRFIWSQITHDSARWEQAFSDDAGATWETNWIMEFRRVV
jgi:hypothetical protein